MVMGNNKAKSGKAEGARCRRHRQQGAGVCASCLRDRLSHLSLSASLPSVVRGEEAEGYSRYHDEEASSCCSEASTAYSSEGSSAASSECASPGDDEPAFHDEMRRAARVSLLMRHERVVGDADAVAAFLRARREQRRRTTATSFWAKLLHATRGGGKKDQGCSMAARGKTLEERAAAAKWVLF
ncbi:unnamed protein product [Miscanthus lutarioriparius]|uniref:Uncharacterized protein n=1 Tax=Miscanthus lutarioriparius TaxID=422564 RepID=A0A811PDT5_9POAL|nr:unnamed protein product [Miscanthus lutarioriparius]